MVLSDEAGCELLSKKCKLFVSYSSVQYKLFNQLYITNKAVVIVGFVAYKNDWAVV